MNLFQVLGLPHNHNKWNVEVIHSKSIVPILHLLVALARHFRPPVRLPENVSVSVTVVQKTQGQLTHRVVREVITSEYSDVGMRCERDAFDTLFDHAPDKLQVVKKVGRQPSFLKLYHSKRYNEIFFYHEFLEIISKRINAPGQSGNNMLKFQKGFLSKCIFFININSTKNCSILSAIQNFIPVSIFF